MGKKKVKLIELEVKKEETPKEVAKPNIWDKYTHTDAEGRITTNIKGIILQMHAEIQMTHEALSYIAKWIEADDAKSDIQIIQKPDIIF